MAWQSLHNPSPNVFESLMMRQFAVPKFKLVLVVTVVLLVLAYVNLLSYQLYVPYHDLANTSKCLGLCYEEFVLDNISHIKPNGIEATVIDRKSFSHISCQFHSVQLAIYTHESPSKLLYGKYKIPGTLILQVRHDGLIGLPGGGIRINEGLHEGLYREIEEELGINLAEYQNSIDYLLSYANRKKKYCGHLFGLGVSWKQIKAILIKAMKTVDLGIENLGYFLMPTINELKDDGASEGFPNFIAQSIIPASPPKMVGNTLQEILYVLTSATNPPILSMEYFDTAVKSARKLLAISANQNPNSDSHLGGTHFDNFYE